jgi:ABC-type nitrate/sulfonate/bicarbonate transport system permease component
MRRRLVGVAPASRAGLQSALGAGLASALLGVLGVALIVAAWWAIAAGGQAVRLPTPPAVVDAVLRDFSDIPALATTTYHRGGLWDALLYTTRNVVTGVTIGVLAGVAVGAATARNVTLRRLFDVPLVVLGTVPILILLPFLVLWFGTSRLGQAGVVIVYTFVTVVVVSQQACATAARRYEQYARSLGASSARTVREVILPAIVPDLIGAVRLAFAAGWGLETVAELIGGSGGVGRIIQAMANLSQTEDLIGAVLCMGIIGVGLDAFIQLAGKRVIRWQE